MKNGSNRNQNKPTINIGATIVVLIILGTALFLLTRDAMQPDEVKYSLVREQFLEENIKSFVVEGGILYAELYNPITESKLVGDKHMLTHKLYDDAIFYEDMNDLILAQKDAGIIVEYDWNRGLELPWWASFVPYIVIIAAFMIFWYFMMNREVGGKGNSPFKVGRAHTRDASKDKKKITFADVAGADEEKEELEEIVEFLKEPKRFADMGARIPKGVLLVGPPGTGKTYLAKAVAGEAGVQFLSISGSDFVELYVGVGASRVRDLFEQAKKAAPSIVFIDEIDAVGRQRGAGLGGGHDEREQTLNQLLVEMDGFGTNEGVIVMAATNRHDILDRALLRPGRFDRTIYVGLPDIRGREEVLKIHTKDKRLAEDVKLLDVAKTTIGFTPADLENLMNESALHATRNGNRFIKMSDVEDAMLKVIAGPAKKSKVVSDKEKRLTAFHEAGHAVAAYGLEHSDPVHHISILPRGRTGGMTIYLPTEDKSYLSKSEMLDEIVSLLGGRAAEKIALKDISTGASNDLQRATEIARNMVIKYGMSDKLGPITFASENDEVFLGRDYGHTKAYSESTATTIDNEVETIIEDAYKRCENILLEHYNILALTAEYLLKNETMDGDSFAYLCEHAAFPPEPEAEQIAANGENASESNATIEIALETDDAVEVKTEI
ncbi:MAG: ATP-dependent zinc metalloprotease FtsH [Oscillospiraceae bacterium]|jgi:cell division protease FtsH|nr:ATP-dependent zinc metalloprotease FtsH [Oscillospiraceae bacterium]